jgi:3-methyladenine DNA glycosylase AlkD
MKKSREKGRGMANAKNVRRPNPTPDEVAQRAVSLIKRKANPERAVGAQRYFKEQVASYGLTSNEVRDIAKALFEDVRGTWSVREAVDLCEILLPNKYLDVKGAATLIFLRYADDFEPDVFSTVKKWLARNYLDNWASVDVLCPDALGGLLEKHPSLIQKIKDWTASPNRWVKRASAVSFIKLARQGKFLNAVYAVSKRLFAVEDDLIEKANGWLLREAGKTDMPRLEKFLMTLGPRIPRTTLRYAIERFPESKRRSILSRTKS